MAKKRKTLWLLMAKTCDRCNLTAYKILTKPYTALDEFAVIDKLNEGLSLAELAHRSGCVSIEVFELEPDGKSIKTETVLPF